MTTTTNTTECAPAQTVTVQYADFRLEEINGVRFYVAVDGTHYEECPRCGGGHGRIAGLEHVMNGVCFRCRGTRMGKATGTHADCVRKVKARIAGAARREAAREAEAARLRALDAARAAEYADAFPDVVAALRDIDALPEPDGEQPLWSLARQALRSGLSTAQTGYASRLLLQRSEKEAARQRSQHLAPIGDKVDVVGTVKVALMVEGYAYNTNQRMIVISTPLGDVKAYSSAQWAYQAKPGDAVSITGATVKKHEEYDGFAQTRIGGRYKAILTPEVPQDELL
jgi:hypothetical protein